MSSEPRKLSPRPGAASRRLADGRDDLLIEEAPLLLDVHGHQLLTMRTPGADLDLARGFLLGEGIADSLDEIVAVTDHPPTDDAPASVRVELQAAPAGLAKARLARTHEIRSSCGACGIADPHALLDDAPALLPGTPRLRGSQLAALTEALTPALSSSSGEPTIVVHA